MNRTRLGRWLRGCWPLVLLLTGCPLPRHDPPVIEEHLTAIAHCDGPVRIVDYERPDGTRFGTTIVWMGCAPQ